MQGATSRYTGNYDWRTCPRSLRSDYSGSEPATLQMQGTEFTTESAPYRGMGFELVTYSLSSLMVVLLKVATQNIFPALPSV